MDDAHTVLPRADVLVVDDRIAAVGPDLPVPEGTVEIDASDGIVLPGMIDTHRHMWQTAMRGYGADWTVTQYFVWYYLESGRHFRPEDVHAGNVLAAIEAIDAGVTTCVDWSHGLQTTEHAEAAVDALRSVPGRFVLAYGNIQQAPWEWSTSAEFRAFARRRIDDTDDMLGFQMAFDVTGDPAFPERAAYETARELGVPVTTHAGVWGATNDDGIRLAHEAGFLDEPPPAARCRSPPRASRAPARATRRPGCCARTASRCPCRWTPACGSAVTCSRRCAPRSVRTGAASTSRRMPRATP
jgi:5-methylthioadenosine/S-adenosylhomocysteine deaminase